MRILSIMLGKSKGGLESVFLTYARLFSEMGHDSFALCHKQSPYIKKLKEIKIPVDTMGASKWNPFAYLSLIKTIKKVRPDILCLHGNRAIYFATSKITTTFIHPFPKIMATSHNDRNRLFHKLDAIFSISQIIKNDLVDRFHIPPEKIFLCPNSVPFPESAPQKYAPHKPFTIGFCGRLHPVKGVDILLKACQKLEEKEKNFQLLIAGDGPCSEQYKELVHKYALTDHVTFLGWINNKKEFFDKIDVLCLPSRSEAQSLSLLEGLSYAKPLIISACPGMLEVVNQTQCALSFPIEDSTALCEKLLLLLQKPDLCSEFSKNAHALFLAKYNETVQKENLTIGIKSVMTH